MKKWLTAPGSSSFVNQHKEGSRWVADSVVRRCPELVRREITKSVGMRRRWGPIGKTLVAGGHRNFDPIRLRLRHAARVDVHLTGTRLVERLRAHCLPRDCPSSGTDVGFARGISNVERRLSRRNFAIGQRPINRELENAVGRQSPMRERNAPAQPVTGEGPGEVLPRDQEGKYLARSEPSRL